MAKKYIDCEVAIEKLCDRCGECLKAKGKDCAVVRIMDKVPAADVAEVRHGHWRITWNVETGAYDAICSNCDRFIIPAADVPIFSYCPCCGARMEKSEGEDNV